MTKEIIAMSLVMCFAIFKVCGQVTTFEYLMQTPMNEKIADILEAEDGYIYIVGMQTKANYDLYKSLGFVIKLGGSGQFIDSSLYNIPEKRYIITDILKDNSDQFILGGISTDTFPQYPNNYGNCNIELKKIDPYLNTTLAKTFFFPPEHKFYDNVVYRGLNQEILFGGSIAPDIVPKMFFYVFNEAFDSIAGNFYLDRFRTCYSIKQLNDTSYWICDGEKSSYYLLDKNLNITDYDYARPYWNYTPGIKWDSDTSFYLAGQWNGGPNYDIGLYKQFDPIDSTGNLFNSWGTTDTVDIPALLNSALDFNTKDSVFIGGTTNFSFYFTPTPSWYFILQTDSNLNVRWERFYGGDARYTMSCIKASNDGGCIIAGNKYDYLNDTVEQLDIHILKLNSEGLLVSTPEQAGIEMHEAILFPNPGADHIKLRIASQYKQSTFEMFNISGRQVLSKRIVGKWGEINTGQLSPGTYVYRIYNQDGLFESGKWIRR